MTADVYNDQKDTRLDAAQQNLALIETRITYVLSHLQAAVKLLLNRQSADDLIVWDAELRDRLVIDDFETHIKHWQFLIPNDLDQLAMLAHMLMTKYPFNINKYPQLATHLRLKDYELQRTYFALFRRDLLLQPPEVARRTTMPNTVNKLTDFLLSNDVGTQLEWCLLRRGETLFYQGDEGDSLYVVMEGLVRVSAHAGGEERLLLELGRGEIMGEIALLTGDKRSATVYAVRDTQLCKLSKAGFEFLIKKYPIVMMQISVQMAHRMNRQDPRQTPFIRPVMLTVLPLTGGTQAFVSRLVDTLTQFGSTAHFNRERISLMYHNSHANSRLNEHIDDYEFVAWLNSQAAQYQYVVYETDTEMSSWTQRCIEQTDRILLVAQADEQPSMSSIEHALRQQDTKLVAPAELVLLHADQKRRPSGTDGWLKSRNVVRHHHVPLDTNAGIERLVRFLRGKAVGLVFGGGGVRGSAHVGAIQALNEAGIRADFVGGTSVGSVAATQYALEWSVEKMLRDSEDYLASTHVLLDYTFPFVALAAAQRVNHGLTKLYEDIRLEDLWINCFCVSTNLSNRQIRIHKDGLIRRAVRASISLPGIYPPVLDDNGDFLVDGGLINNVPVDIMKLAVDGGTVIAVDVGQEQGWGTDYEFGDSVSGWRVLLNRINPFVKTKAYPSIFSTILRSATIGNDAAVEGKAAYIDLYLKPPVDHFGLFSANAYQSIYELGYNHAVTKIKEWNDAKV
ncbi:MAG: patatin-like phospholipase family protein [Chloroflexi bacterium]|nr:patatin-like phospholipase family protein [Chloroflexota bacterium]MCC6896602.1 patatin-like phospholipase family protein [Anaerolineae bacterium]